jgi:hypothetical protein
VQFVRQGYVVRDPRAGKPVFDRTVGLRDLAEVSADG